MRISDLSSDVCSSDLSIVERLLKIIHQIMQARIAVRLNHGDHPPLCALASSSEHRPDLHGVMAVIVNDSRLAPGQIDYANVRDAPLAAAELGKAVMNRCIINAHMKRPPHSTNGVEKK